MVTISELSLLACSTNPTSLAFLSHVEQGREREGDRYGSDFVEQAEQNRKDDFLDSILAFHLWP